MATAQGGHRGMHASRGDAHGGSPGSTAAAAAVVLGQYLHQGLRSPVMTRSPQDQRRAMAAAAYGTAGTAPHPEVLSRLERMKLDRQRVKSQSAYPVATRIGSGGVKARSAQDLRSGSGSGSGSGGMAQPDHVVNVPFQRNSRSASPRGRAGVPRSGSRTPPAERKAHRKNKSYTFGSKGFEAEAYGGGVLDLVSFPPPTSTRAGPGTCHRRAGPGSHPPTPPRSPHQAYGGGVPGAGAVGQSHGGLWRAERPAPSASIEELLARQAARGQADDRPYFTPPPTPRSMSPAARSRSPVRYQSRSAPASPRLSYLRRTRPVVAAGDIVPPPTSANPAGEADLDAGFGYLDYDEREGHLGFDFDDVAGPADDEVFGFHVEDDPYISRPGVHAEAGAGPSAEPSPQTQERMEAFKTFMEESHCGGSDSQLLRPLRQRRRRREQLEDEMVRRRLTRLQKQRLRGILCSKETEYLRLQRQPVGPGHFQVEAQIGRGAFGKVFLVTGKATGALYAMKKLKKDLVYATDQVEHVKAERQLMAEADSDWVVKLFFSFQTAASLYLVMEYVPGGDLLHLLTEYGSFSEPMARFYVAEIMMAVQSVHSMGFIHRDIKPDNILIDAEGHVKLTDFGLCTHVERKAGATWEGQRGRRWHHSARSQANSFVGTPNYIAPEVFQAVPYGQACDWWSVGVILYEMVVGRPPFLSSSALKTKTKVLNWKETLSIPPSAALHPETKHLIGRLCCDASTRLGRRNGLEEIQAHPFFQGVRWSRTEKSPHRPTLTNPHDVSNFDVQSLQEPTAPRQGASLQPTPRHLFAHFNWRRFWQGSNGLTIPRARSKSSHV